MSRLLNNNDIQTIKKAIKELFLLWYERESHIRHIWYKYMKLGNKPYIYMNESILLDRSHGYTPVIILTRDYTPLGTKLFNILKNSTLLINYSSNLLYTKLKEDFS